jgi:hypothetical protein
VIAVLDNFITFRQHIAPVCVDRTNLFEEDAAVPEGLLGTVAGWG